MAISYTVLFVIGASLALTHAQSDGVETCGLTQRDGVNTFTLHSSSPQGKIPLIHLQYDTTRKLPITSTVVYDNMNLVQNVEREDNFREVECQELNDKQQNCATNMRLSTSQKDKINSEYNSWDRGHLTPVNPMRFSADAVNATFYCPNIAPQEPWSNRCPWYAVEERTLSRSSSFPSYVITGVCDADNAIDGNSYHGLIVPNCFWKMQCYVDPTTKRTEVIGFVQDNSLIAASSRDADRNERKHSTTTPRTQQEIRDLMGAQAKFINRAWTAAEKELTTGRQINGNLPTAAACGRRRDIPQQTMENWEAWMKLHRPPFGCPSLKN